MLVIQPRRGQASKLGTQISAAQSQLASARSQVAQGVAARSQFANYYTQLVRLGEAVPYGRFGRPEEMAGAALFLASDDAEYIVAQTLGVDGGNWMA